MESRRSALEGWTPEQLALGRAWAATWRDAGPRLEAIRRQELRALDAFAAIALLCGAADYQLPPRAPAPTSGLLEQQRLFMRLRPL
ncbi:hypothetical protein LuPra_06232 [Luteitalea pratensis]|uniref:Uncharacterized protein n=1 Tax=Luteitalea pratensis TaxID=1855912 RepID=A0A143PXK2_LUTPR|nr:hypothetical protein [Luteitalea pratensis]AMY12948.1 hypothetical protein LuPra_06232 [Luteitalea pratensis]